MSQDPWLFFLNYYCLIGLDSYNAFNVIESLATLAKQYNRTVVFTIHQPQSNITSMFDRLLLLSKGRMVYAGDFKQCQRHFASIGHECPQGYNIADYLSELAQVERNKSHRWYTIDVVDLTTKAAGDHRSDRSQQALDVESGSTTPVANAQETSENDNAYRSGSSIVNKVKSTAIGWASALSSKSEGGGVLVPAIPDKLAQLVEGFQASDQAKITEAELHRLHHGVGLDGLREVTSETTPFRTYKRASWWTQFKTLSGRAFKNLYR
jgi:hypothetical protein